jgi:hypothetical protein
VPPDAHDGTPCTRVLTDVRQRLGDDVVRRGLDLRRKADALLGLEPHGQRGARRKRAERRREPALGEKRRMQAARELPQLGVCAVHALDRAVEQLRGARRILLERAARQPERVRDEHELLLRAVVEVALDTLPLGVSRSDDPSTRAAELRRLAHPRGDVDARKDHAREPELGHDRRAGPVDQAALTVSDDELELGLSRAFAAAHRGDQRPPALTGPV